MAIDMQGEGERRILVKAIPVTQRRFRVIPHVVRVRVGVSSNMISWNKDSAVIHKTDLLESAG